MKILWCKESSYLSVVIALLFLASTSNAQTFNYTDFSDTSNLTFVRSAATFNNRLRLNGDGTVGSTAGNVWTDGKYDVASGFTTSFTFEIGTTTIGSGSDLLYFQIQNLAPDATKAYPAYASSPVGGTDFTDNYLQIGIDTYWNSWDPNNWHLEANYVGKNATSATQIDVVVLPDGKNSNLHQIDIEYDALNTRLRIFYDGVKYSDVELDISQALDLDNGKAWIGFMGVSGFTPETHDVRSWSFTSVPEPTSLTLAFISLIVMLKRSRSGRIYLFSQA